MAAQWYCLIGLKQYGPFTGEQVRQLVQQGQLQREHGVRTETDSEWTAAGDLPGLFPPPEAAPVQLTAPTATTKLKKKPIGPAVAVPPYPQPAAPAPNAVQSATPLIPPGAAVPVAAPAVAAPVAMPTPVAPITAAPVARVPAAAIPVAAAPVAFAVRAAPIAPAVASRAPDGPAQVRPVSAVRPIPLNPVVPPMPPTGTARATSPKEGTSRRSRASRKKKSQMVVGGLGAAILLLIVIAVMVLNSRPGKKPGGGTARTTASSKGASGDPEIEPGAVLAANAEPAEIADPVQPVAPAAKPAAPEAKAATLPEVSRWLEATRQKGGIRDVVRLGVGNAWLDSADGKPAILNVEIQITNLSPDAPLDFAGWRPEAQPQTKLCAVMADDAQTLLAAAPSRVAAKRRTARRRIAPGLSETEQLSFVMPDRDSRQFRLALPYAALGQTGYLGFELPRQMIKDLPPGAEEPAPKGPAKVASETSLPATGAIKPEPGEPETIGDLRTEIEQSGDRKMESMDEPVEPAAEAPPPKEPEKIPDIRKLIEEQDPKMESTNEEQPNEKEPNEKEPPAEPKSP